MTTPRGGSRADGPLFPVMPANIAFPQVMVGKKVTEVRHMTAEEAQAEGWEWATQRPFETPVVIVLEGNMKLYASADSEGNGPGQIFGRFGVSHFRVTLFRRS